MNDTNKLKYLSDDDDDDEDEGSVQQYVIPLVTTRGHSTAPQLDGRLLSDVQTSVM